MTNWKSLLLGVGAGLVFAATALAGNGDTPDRAPAATQAADPAVSVQGLYQQCTGGTPEQVYCLGYITGVAESMIVLGGGRDSSAHSFGVCSKVTISPAAEVQAFKNWAERHPEMWGQIRYIGVLFALREHWPCA